MEVGALDIVFAVIMLVAVIRCVYRGFITEIHSVAALIAGVVVAILLAKPVARLLEEHIGIANWTTVVAFLAVFLTVYIVVKISEGLIHRIFEKLQLDRLDRALGFFLGIIEGILIIGVIVFALEIQPFFDVTELLEESYIAGLMYRLLPKGIELFQSKEGVHV
jgi:membrane protein required for colicin V production